MKRTKVCTNFLLIPVLSRIGPQNPGECGVPLGIELKSELVNLEAMGTGHELVRFGASMQRHVNRGAYPFSRWRDAYVMLAMVVRPTV